MDQQRPHDPNETSATAPSSPSSAGSSSASSRRMFERTDETPPERIGSYRILRELGRGGMGMVYLAVRDDDKFHKRVAIKVIRKGMDTEDILKRFDQERQLLGAMNHPNIARLLDGGKTDDGRPFFVVEYVEGLALDKHCDSHRLKISERLDLFRIVCSAVHYAHQNLVVHRDLKPSNILVTSAGDVKLLDFGIAKLLNPDLVAFTQTPTAPELRLMTPEYASPEQVRGDPLTTASDVYSLGVLLYELLTGHRPYRIKTRVLQEVVRVICEVEPERPSAAVTRVEEVPDPTSAPASGAQTATRTLGPAEVSRTREGRPDRLRRRLAGDVDNIVLKAMRKEPQRRYASALALSEDLKRHLDGMPVDARPDSLPYRARKFIARNRLGVGAAAAIFLALTIGLAGVTWQRNLAVRAHERADRIAGGMTQMSSLLLRVFNEMDSFRSSVGRREMFVKDVRDSLQALADDAPEFPAAVRTLAAAHAVVGDVQGGIRGPSVGKPEEALASYAESVRLLTELAETNPEPQLRSELAAAMLSLADAQNSARKSEDALATYRLAEQKAREALAGGKRDVFTKRVLAATLLKQGDLLRVQSDFEGARGAYEQSFAIRRELVGAEPADSAEKRDIAVALGRFAQLKADTGDLDGAVQAMRESVALRRENADAETAPHEPRPDSLRAARDLMIGLLTLGAFLSEQGDLDEAAATLRDAVARAEIVRDLMPDNARGPRDLSIAQRHLGQALLSLNRPDEALAVFRQAAIQAQHAVAMAPEERISNESLRDTRLAAARVMTTLGRSRDALVELAGASEVSSGLLAVDAERRTHRVAAAEIASASALARWADAPADGLAELRAAYTASQTLAEESPDDAGSAALRTDTGLSLAWALMLSSDAQEARPVFDELLLATGPAAKAAGASRAARAAHADVLAGLASLDAPVDAPAALARAREAHGAAPDPSARVLWALARAQRASKDADADATFAEAIAVLAKAPSGSPDARLKAAIERDRNGP